MPFEINYSNTASTFDFTSSPNEKVKLGPSFQPGPHTVICARGRRAFNHEGNQRFRALVKLHEEAYAVATCKYQKSKIVSHIVNTVRRLSPEGGFVKEIKGVYFEVGDRAAKEKVGQTFRDLLHKLYPSSTKAKAQARIQQRIEEYNASDILDMDASTTLTTGNQWVSDISVVTNDSSVQALYPVPVSVVNSPTNIQVVAERKISYKHASLTELIRVDSIHTIDEISLGSMSCSTFDDEPLSLDDDSIGSIDFDDTEFSLDLDVSFEGAMNNFCELIW